MSRLCSGVLLRFSPDQIAGERLNFGVVAVDHETSVPAIRISRRMGRLSRAFAGFNYREYRRVTRALIDAIESRRRTHAGSGVLPGLEEYVHAVELMVKLWPDRGTQYTFSQQFIGESQSVDHFADLLFEQYVVGQGRERTITTSTSDKAVWTKYTRDLLHRDLVTALKPTLVETSVFRHEFDFTLEKSGLHILQPLSFDLADEESIQEKASRWFGYLYSLEERTDLASITLLLAPPRAEGRDAYLRALTFLRQSPVKPRIFDEPNSSSFETELEKLVG